MNASLPRPMEQEDGPSAVCSVCGPDIYSYSVGGKDNSVAALRGASETGCQECSLVLAALEAHETGWCNRHESSGFVNRRVAYNGDFFVQIHGSNSSNFLSIHHHQSLVVDHQSQNEFLFSSSRDIIRETHSSAGLDRASAWLSLCLESHKECKSAEKNFLPRRLIEIRAKETQENFITAEEFSIRLAESNLLPLNTQYVALSYCWGTDLEGVVTTTSKNVEAHHRHIDFQYLSKTIQDALRVCRALGTCFLWVDALCIVQDDKDEWQKEAATMQYVYQNSLVTLAIHEAKCCKDGFLGEQEFGQDQWQSSFYSSYKLPGSTTITMTKFHIRPRSSFRSFANVTALSQRGWTLQESIFPTRILHYMGTEMAWECADSRFCECGHLDDHVGDMANPLVKSSLRHLSNRIDVWMKLITAYTARSITYDSDKLVAISGLARHISDTFLSAADAYPIPQAHVEEKLQVIPCWSPGRYLAGIFLGLFPGHLLWHLDTYYDEIYPARPELYRAPTWSWASSNAQITFPSEYWGVMREKCSLVAVHEHGTFCTPATPNDLFGAVTHAELRIEGKLVPAALVMISSPSTLDRSAQIRLQNGETEWVALDIVRGVDVVYGDPALECWRECQHVSREQDDDYNPQSTQKCEVSRCLVAEASGFWCLAISICWSPIHKNYKTFFLLLEPSARVPGAYERIGMGPVARKSIFSSDDEKGCDFWDGAETQVITIV